MCPCPHPRGSELPTVSKGSLFSVWGSGGRQGRAEAVHWLWGEPDPSFLLLDPAVPEAEPTPPSKKSCENALVLQLRGPPRPHSGLTIHEKGSAWLSEARGLMIHFSEKPRLQMATGRAVFGPAQERPATSSHRPLPGVMWTVLRSPNSDM